MTKSAFDQMSRICRDPLATLSSLSQSKILLAIKAKGDRTAKIHTAGGTYLCRESDDGLLITGFYRNTLLDQNAAMKYGICFHVSSGIIIQLRLRSPYEYYFDIVQGAKYYNKEYADKSVAPSVKLILDQVAASEAPAEKEEAAQEPEYRPERKLANLLKLAESYSVLESDVAELEANRSGNVAYSGVESVQFDRIDRVVYQFGVTGLDEKVFKAGVQVEIEDKEQVRHAAEIVELVKADSDSPATAIKIMFNEQISISQFYSSGFFSLSFSTVNKDVQLAANEKIRTGEAKAKYMDTVLGRGSTAGFDRKDLTQVKAKLQQKKYPPNKSQMDAICAGINSRDVFLVMGPPGTGKTTVILEWVKYFVTQEHKRVLVSSQNNKAVDNVLARLAEEKDIDVIRIGSENKLQSDVIPYMFENKVAALRESIVTESEKNRGVIDASIAQWMVYLRQTDTVTQLQAKTANAWSQFSGAVEQKLKPLYKRLQEQLNRFSLLQRRKADYVGSMWKYVRKLERHENARNFLVRFFTGLFYKHNKTKLRSFSAKLSALTLEENTLTAAYAREYAGYRAALAELRDTPYTLYDHSKRLLSSALAGLKNKPGRSAEDIWDLFSRSRACPVNRSQDFPALRKAVEQDIAHARQLHQALSTWQEDMRSKQNYALNEIVLESVDLVGATCIGINSQRRFANLDFDVTIIDEAGQIQVHNALVPMSVSNKLIMLGDHKQIPPMVNQDLEKLCVENNVSTDMLEMSLFEKMYNDLPASNKIMLDTQYRMPAEIADTISEWFYGGEYYSPDFKRGLKSPLPALSEKPFVVIDTSDEFKRYETKVEGEGCYNTLEASIAAAIVKKAAADPETNLKEIGVISAYSSQVKVLRKMLGKFLPGSTVSEMVATLDSYQGQERDIIIYSFTKSSNINPYSQRIGFLCELRRLNVAMTRCKKMLILIGDMRFLGGCRHFRQDEFGEEILVKNERQFSGFINKMMRDVRGGRGEVLSFRDFTARMKGGDR